MERVQALEGMWVTTLAEIAEHAEATDVSPRVHTRFEVPDFPDGPVLANGSRVGRELSRTGTP